MSSISLLVFNRDDIDGVVRLLRILGNIVDESVVIDSSSPTKYGELINAIEGLGLSNVRVYRAIPMGYPDPLRAYGLSKVKTEYVLYLDTDEVPNRALIRDLRGFNEADGYEILFCECDRKSLLWHMHLFRRDSVTFRGIVHELLEIRGRVVRLPTRYFILHIHGNDAIYYTYPHYFAMKYSVPELLIKKPYEVNLIRGENLPSSLLGTLYLIFRRIFNIYMDSLRGGVESKEASWWNRYELSLYMRYLVLPRWFRYFVDFLSRDVNVSGGVIKYLCLNDPGVVEDLTNTFTWDVPGYMVFAMLLIHRFITGRCARNFNEVRGVFRELAKYLQLGARR
ncbi:hypothetical protein [Caldivirga maquilingensis]|uniref:Glycosyl transferase family 2 n=1 Tax=Caldivirga maquilingensis (strain ATCC 700844 / DSM 13496 / JCM 10307 / IC-167) TaxID=397948 RepID=A8M977_CALMQ|nr:hypothetical protein [Caldivirga maquilingensis]ABW02296.1 hypothetical protein Cmaq_1472 [Caldivirga maquilingensis IC-167]